MTKTGSKRSRDTPFEPLPSDDTEPPPPSGDTTMDHLATFPTDIQPPFDLMFSGGGESSSAYQGDDEERRRRESEEDVGTDDIDMVLANNLPFREHELIQFCKTSSEVPARLSDTGPQAPSNTNDQFYDNPYTPNNELQTPDQIKQFLMTQDSEPILSPLTPHTPHFEDHPHSLSLSKTTPLPMYSPVSPLPTPTPQEPSVVPTMNPIPGPTVLPSTLKDLQNNRNSNTNQPPVLPNVYFVQQGGNRGLPLQNHPTLQNPPTLQNAPRLQLQGQGLGQPQGQPQGRPHGQPQIQPQIQPQGQPQIQIKPEMPVLQHCQNTQNQTPNQMPNQMLNQMPSVTLQHNQMPTVTLQPNQFQNQQNPLQPNQFQQNQMHHNPAQYNPAQNQFNQNQQGQNQQKMFIYQTQMQCQILPQGFSQPPNSQPPSNQLSHMPNKMCQQQQGSPMATQQQGSPRIGQQQGSPMMGQQQGSQMMGQQGPQVLGSPIVSQQQASPMIAQVQQQSSSMMMGQSPMSPQMQQQQMQQQPQQQSRFIKEEPQHNTLSQQHILKQYQMMVRQQHLQKQQVPHLTHKTEPQPMDCSTKPLNHQDYPSQQRPTLIPKPATTPQYAPRHPQQCSNPMTTQQLLQQRLMAQQQARLQRFPQPAGGPSNEGPRQPGPMGNKQAMDSRQPSPMNNGQANPMRSMQPGSMGIRQPMGNRPPIGNMGMGNGQAGPIGSRQPMTMGNIGYRPPHNPQLQAPLTINPQFYPNIRPGNSANMRKPGPNIPPSCGPGSPIGNTPPGNLNLTKNTTIKERLNKKILNKNQNAAPPAPRPVQNTPRMVLNANTSNSIMGTSAELINRPTRPQERPALIAPKKTLGFSGDMLLDQLERKQMPSPMQGIPPRLPNNMMGR